MQQQTTEHVLKNGEMVSKLNRKRKTSFKLLYQSIDLDKPITIISDSEIIIVYGSNLNLIDF